MLNPLAKEFLNECLTPQSRVYATIMVLSLIGFLISVVVLIKMLVKTFLKA